MKIRLTIILIIIAVSSIFLWRFLGNPYYRISLIGKEYIKNADELTYANEQLNDKLYLIKKYKYSKDVLLFGFGGGNSSTDDYYWYGVADKNKNILIEPKYQFISSKTNTKKEPIIIVHPYLQNEKIMFYKIEDNNVELISKEASR